jgi:F420H(2)-dependent quinone reductase
MLMANLSVCWQSPASPQHSTHDDGQVRMTHEKTVKPIPEGLNGLIRGIMKAYTRLNVAVYRASNGRLMNSFPNGSPICLVTMIGRRSGRRRTIPLIHVPDGDRVILVASQGGMSTHPLWYHNLKANPAVGVTADGITRRMIAREAAGSEKAAAWRVAVKAYPDYADYQARTTRAIPVFICEPER